MSIRCGKCRGRHESAGEVRACYGRAAAPAASAPAQEPVAAPLEPGFYRSGPKVFRLQEDRSWALLSASGRWMAGCRAPYRPARMTVEEVAAEGRRVVRCIVCGTRLKKPESIAAGIGPVCAGRV